MTKKLVFSVFILISQLFFVKMGMSKIIWKEVGALTKIQVEAQDNTEIQTEAKTLAENRIESQIENQDVSQIKTKIKTLAEDRDKNQTESQDKSQIKTKVQAETQANQYNKIVLIINQVRGTECCDVGSLKYLFQQIKVLKNNNLKGNFSVRYDALVDSNFTNVLKNLDNSQFELGAFLEITPKLALDSGVKYGGNEYKGNTDKWYEAQNVYLVGYSHSDRKKIIDTYMAKFFAVFGRYPKFVSAWIIDTSSANYMNSKYGTFIYQITREQWGTDSYTLSGGPVHYPYFASKNWLFVKDQKQSLTQLDNSTSNSKQNIVLRQTGSDPLYNYGDTTSSFTTQPNDYDRGNRKIEYFNKLKNNFFDQKQNKYGFLLLGLENSMADRYQDEFAKQLISLSKISEINSMRVSQFSRFLNDNDQSIVGLSGRDTINSSDTESFWVNAPNYRIRLIYKNKELMISDLRIFNKNLTDPYDSYIAKNLAFWVTPFIFNASQNYSLEQKSNLTYTHNFKAKILDNLRKKYLPELQEYNLEIKSPSNDLSSYFDTIYFAKNIKKMLGFSRDKNNNLLLNYLDQDGNVKTLAFFQNSIKTNFLLNKQNIDLRGNDLLSFMKKKDGFQISFHDKKNNSYYSLTSKCNKNECEIAFNQPNDESFNKLRTYLYPYFFPEIKKRPISNSESIFYPHNRYAVAGKNPVRFVFIPKDKLGFATAYKDKPQISTIPKAKKIILHAQQSNGTTFLDLASDKVGKYQVNFSVGDLVNKTEAVFFAPNCKVNRVHCLFHPIELKWYLSSMFYTKLRNF